MKKYLSILLAAAVVTGLAGCGGSNTGTTQAPATQASESKAPDAQADTQADDAEETEASGTGDFHIGIVTGSVSQSEDDRRGAEAFQKMYGEDVVKLAISFTVVKNITAENGERTIYIRITKPDNDVLTKSASNTFPYENRTLVYSIKKYIAYNGEEQNINVFWDVEEFLYAGNYRVDIFEGGNLIGSQTFTLN